MSFIVIAGDFYLDPGLVDTEEGRAFVESVKKELWKMSNG